MILLALRGTAEAVPLQSRSIEDVLVGLEPDSHLQVASFPGKVGCRLAGIAFMGRIGSMGDERFGQIAAVGRGG
jgi:hypothetical protein